MPTVSVRRRAKVCRRRIAVQPFSVIRGRRREVLARNPRSSSRSTTTVGGHRFLKNAKSRKKLRSPRCRPCSTHKRANGDGPDNFAPPPPGIPTEFSYSQATCPCVGGPTVDNY